jgi:C_GCAxxG_C_C family probable redox protein
MYIFKSEDAMNKSEKAKSIFNDFNCAQSVLAAFSSDFGLSDEISYKIAGSFGGGLGRSGKTCGAVSGALMVLGLRYAQTKPGEAEKKEKNYEMVREFIKKFTAKNGSCVCAELLGYDISTPEGAKAAKEKGLFSTVCGRVVGDAAEIVETLL